MQSLGHWAPVVRPSRKVRARTQDLPSTFRGRIKNEGNFQNTGKLFQCYGVDTNKTIVPPLNSINWVHPKDHRHLWTVATAGVHIIPILEKLKTTRTPPHTQVFLFFSRTSFVLGLLTIYIFMQAFISALGGDGNFLVLSEGKKQETNTLAQK